MDLRKLPALFRYYNGEEESPAIFDSFGVCMYARQVLSLSAVSVGVLIGWISGDSGQNEIVV